MGLGLHRQRADRDRRARRSATSSSPSRSDPTHAALDPVGAVLSIVALGALLWVDHRGARARLELDRRSSPASSSASCCSAAFFAWELHSPHPMLDMRFFENPRFSAASGAITLVFLALFGTLFLLTQYLQSVLGYSTVKAGAVLLPQAATMMIFAPLSQRLGAPVRQQGRRRHRPAAGRRCRSSLFAHVPAEQQRAARHRHHDADGPRHGQRHGARAPTRSWARCPGPRPGVGSAVNDTTRQMGGAIGVAVFGSLMASHFTSSMADELGGVRPGRPARPGRRQRRPGASASPARCRRAQPFAAQIVSVGERQLRQRPAHRRLRRRRPSRSLAAVGVPCSCRPGPATRTHGARTAPSSSRQPA